MPAGQQNPKHRTLPIVVGNNLTPLDAATRWRLAGLVASLYWFRIIADYLLHSGDAVFHIVGAKRVEPAQMTPSAKPNADNSLTYRSSA